MHKRNDKLGPQSRAAFSAEVALGDAHEALDCKALLGTTIGGHPGSTIFITEVLEQGLITDLRAFQPSASWDH